MTEPATAVTLKGKAQCGEVHGIGERQVGRIFHAVRLDQPIEQIKNYSPAFVSLMEATVRQTLKVHTVLVPTARVDAIGRTTADSRLL
jgi:hypothetical protein